jgi:hypothetical protein
LKSVNGEKKKKAGSIDSGFYDELMKWGLALKRRGLPQISGNRDERWPGPPHFGHG